MGIHHTQYDTKKTQERILEEFNGRRREEKRKRGARGMGARDKSVSYYQSTDTQAGRKPHILTQFSGSTRRPPVPYENTRASYGWHGQRHAWFKTPQYSMTATMTPLWFRSLFGTIITPTSRDATPVNSPPLITESNMPFRRRFYPTQRTAVCASNFRIGNPSGNRNHNPDWQASRSTNWGPLEPCSTSHTWHTPPKTDLTNKPVAPLSEGVWGVGICKKHISNLHACDTHLYVCEIGQL